MEGRLKVTDALAKAISLLEKQPLFEEQLRSRLAAYPDDEAEAAIAELTSRHILDDQRLLDEFIASHKGKSLLSAEGIRAKLAAKGVTFVPDDLPEPSKEEVMEALRSRCFRPDGDSREMAKAVRWLMSRGFSNESAAEAAASFFKDFHPPF